MTEGGFRRRRDQASLLLLFFLFAILPATVAFGHRGVAPWLLLAALPAFARGDFWLASFGALFDQLDPRRPFVAGFLAICAFCAWIFISGFWSPRAMPSLALWVLAPALVGGAVVWFSIHVSKVWAYMIALSYAAAVIAGMGVLLFEGLSGGALRGALPPADPTPGRIDDIIELGRGVTALAPAMFPAAIIAAAVWNRYAGLGVVLLGVAAAFSNDVSANAVALAVGLIAAILAFKAPRGMIISLLIAALAALLLAPLATYLPVEAAFALGEGVLPSSWLHRIAIWQTAAARIPEGLPFGFGADYARIWSESAPMIVVPDTSELLPVIPNHPHNLFLQTWLELGLPGVFALAIFLIAGARVLASANLQKPIVAASCGAFAAILVSILVEASLWQVWRLASMAVAAMGVGLAYSLHVNWSRLP
ncbi:MAG: O-antigen ligase family protein [Pseudomonadota bacterium]